MVFNTTSQVETISVSNIMIIPYWLFMFHLLVDLGAEKKQKPQKLNLIITFDIFLKKTCI